MKPLNARYFKLSNVVFEYGLTPIQLSVYSYLVCCAGQRGEAWPSMKTIAINSGCSKNSARSAVDELVRRRFIRKCTAYRTDASGRSRQSNNHYFILDLPTLPPKREVTYYTVSDVCEPRVAL